MKEDKPKRIELIEICEDGGLGEIRIDGREIREVTDYVIKRGTDFSEITLTLSVPTRKLRTFTKE